MSEWTEIARLDDVPEDGTLRVSFAGEPVCLYNMGGGIYATHDVCTHGQASLSEGFIDGENIECPLHQGMFHIPTGEAVRPPCTENVKVYLVKVEDGAIYIKEPE
jgi:nitrite reductase/ring-hydroxylating ferredoxin subunit